MKRYAMLIRWSDNDAAYAVSLPEWGHKSFGEIVTHGATYEEAARNGQEALDLLIEDALARGEPLPEPVVLDKLANCGGSHFTNDLSGDRNG